MGIQIHFLLALAVLILANAATGSLPFRRNYEMSLVGRRSATYTPTYKIDSLNRSSFPAGFVFGAASAAYQYEGAWNEDGKGPSIWDTFTHEFPEKISDGSNGDVALDSYHRYKEDVRILKRMGMDAYRFSISWSRVLPGGNLSAGVNEKGIKYYDNLINRLKNKGLEPYVTLFHWDLPQALQDLYGGFMSHRIVKDFSDFAELCFQRFGDRVKHWITLNEPWSYSSTGYALGTFAPGRCSAWLHNNCTGGDSATEPYEVSHLLLLSHAAAVKRYKDNYQAAQQGQIGITLVASWLVPYTNSRLDRRAAVRGLDFQLGWFMEPLVYGRYPINMRILVKNRLPRFSKEESDMVKGSYDFIGINYYTSNYASPSNSIPARPSYMTDSRVNQTAERNGVLIGKQAGSTWLYVYPQGIRDLLIYVKQRYKNPPIYITENGVDEVNNATLSLKQSLIDPFRIQYYYEHYTYALKAIQEGVNLKGHFAWSLLDNFEWNVGYTVRFGINYVNYTTLDRFPKLSAKWFKNFLQE